MNLICKILLYIFIFLIFIYLIIKVKNAIYEKKEDVSEHFSDKLDYSIEYLLNEYKEKDDDIFDKEFVDLYDIAYHDFFDINRDNKVILKYLPKSVKDKKDTTSIVVGGCGVGKVCKSWKDLGYPNIKGVDFSKHMLKRAETLYPNIDFIRGNLVDHKILPDKSAHLFIIDERTLYMNHTKDIEKIIKNAYHWLYDDGILVVPIYDKSELQLASRYYSTTYIDNLGLVHGFTYLDNFSHDCWYVPDLDEDNDNDKKEKKEKSERLLMYFDKFTFKDGKKRIKPTLYYFSPKTEIYDIILKSGFEKIHIEPVCTQIVGGYELAIFKKKKNSINVSELQFNKGKKDYYKK